jgi:hypothetical protein
MMSLFKYSVKQTELPTPAPSDRAVLPTGPGPGGVAAVDPGHARVVAVEEPQAGGELGPHPLVLGRHIQ